MAVTSVGLLQGLQHGSDADSWQTLVDEYEPFLQRCLIRFGAPAEEIDDVIQDALIVVHRRIAEYEHNGRPGAFRKWLQAITYNCLRDGLRGRRSRPAPRGGSQFQALMSDLEGGVSELSVQLDREHRQHILAGLLQQVRNDFSAQTWKVFDHLTLREEAPEEVAEKFEMTTAAVYAAKSRVMTKLRRLAQDAGLED